MIHFVYFIGRYMAHGVNDPHLESKYARAGLVVRLDDLPGSSESVLESAFGGDAWETEWS